MGGRELGFAISFFSCSIFFFFFSFSNGIGFSKLPLWGGEVMFSKGSCLIIL